MFCISLWITDCLHGITPDSQDFISYQLYQGQVIRGEKVIKWTLHDRVRKRQSVCGSFTHAYGCVAQVYAQAFCGAVSTHIFHILSFVHLIIFWPVVPLKNKNLIHQLYRTIKLLIVICNWGCWPVFKALMISKQRVQGTHKFWIWSIPLLFIIAWNIMSSNISFSELVQDTYVCWIVTNIATIK